VIFKFPAWINTSLIWSCFQAKNYITYYSLYLKAAHKWDNHNYNHSFTRDSTEKRRFTQLTSHRNVKEKQEAGYTLIKQFLKYMIYRLLPLSMIQFQKPLSWSNTCHHKINIKHIPQKTDNFFDKSYQMIALVNLHSTSYWGCKYVKLDTKCLRIPTLKIL
jgi:hypothetical protein